MSALLQRLVSPPEQILSTLQPTPSTIKYTVSTRPVAKSTVAIVERYVGALLRILIGLCVVVLLWMKFQLDFEKPSFPLHCVFNDSAEAELFKFAEACLWQYLAPAALFILFLVFRRGYTEESLTLLRGLGVQTSTSSSTYLQAPTTRFIPTTSIQDIFIHEAFKGFEVRFYLAIVVEGEESAVVVFPTLLPRRVVLEEVWRGAKRCLWESSGTTTASDKEKEKGKDKK